MAYSKVILNGTTLMDVTQKTVAADKMLTGYTALKNDGTDITGTYSGGGGGLPGWTDITSTFTLDGSYDYFQALYRAQSDTVVFFGQCGINGSAPSVSTITPSGNYVPDVATLYAMDAGMQPMGTITAVNLHMSTYTVYDFFPFTEDLVWDLTQNSTPLDDTPDVCFYCMYIVNA